MAFMDCVNRALQAKQITGKKADEARERYGNFYKSAIADGRAPIDAEDFAAEQATRSIETEKAQAKTAQLKQMAWSIDDWHQWQKDLAANPKRIGWYANSVIEGTVGGSPGRISLNDRTTTAEGRIKRFLTDMTEKYSPKLTGLVYPKAGQENIVRELFRAGSTGDKAAEGFAKAWTKATDYGVDLYQRAGGILNHLEEWRLPQHEDRTKMLNVGSQLITRDGQRMTQWAADHMGWLEWDKMQWPNGTPIDPADRLRVLDEVQKTMKTGGDIRIKPGQYRGAGGSFSDHRFMIFKDADSWLAAHDKYGVGDIYETMMHHVETMSRRIGVAETFGPKPQIGLAQMINNMKLAAARADVADANGGVHRDLGGIGAETTYTDRAARAERFLRDAFAAKVQGINSLENGSAALLSDMLGGAGSLIRSAVLGSVYLYQGTQDFFTAALRYRLAGLPVMKSVGTYFKLFVGHDAATIKTLERAGFINLSASRVGQAKLRLTGLDIGGPRIAQRISDTVMRASLTEWHAASARFTTAAEFCGALADWRELPFDKLPGKVMLETHGITPDDWDRMRATPLDTTTGHDFLFPDDHIRKTSIGTEDERYGVADKFMSMINQEAKLATIETQVAAQLVLKGNTRAGTLVGEIMRSFAMFKNFPLTVFNTHIRQGLLMPTIPGKIGYLATTVTGLTLMGAIGVMLHDVAAGKNPQSAKDPWFWTRAALAGGSFSLLGDAIAGNLEHGKALGVSVAGPLVEEMSDLIDLAGDTGKAVMGTDRNADRTLKRALVRFGSRWTPGSNIWYLRAALRAAVWDNLLKWSDPTAAQVFRRRIKAAQKGTGQSYWWGPGESTPNGPPDFSTLVNR